MVRRRAESSEARSGHSLLRLLFSTIAAVTCTAARPARSAPAGGGLRWVADETRGYRGQGRWTVQWCRVSGPAGGKVWGPRTTGLGWVAVIGCMVLVGAATFWMVPSGPTVHRWLLNPGGRVISGARI